MAELPCRRFLAEALPLVGYRWEGFRKPRRQVCRRVRARMEELGLPDRSAYLRLLRESAGERKRFALDARVTISRFRRDGEVWKHLERQVLPDLAAAASRGERPVRAWSAGCASGEEPWTLRLAWDLAVAPGRIGNPELEILATDVDAEVLRRAERAVYRPGSLRALDDATVGIAFEDLGGEHRLRDRFRRGVVFRRHDVRDPGPVGDGTLDLVLCRNLAFTYFGSGVARLASRGLRGALRPGGWLVVGRGEGPLGPGWVAAGPCCFRRSEDPAAGTRRLIPEKDSS